MELKDIASVSGRPGLFQILKPTRTGVVLESLDDIKSKVIVSSNTKISILKDISMYTINDGSMPLADILIRVNEIFGNSLPVSPKSDEKELRDFFIKVVPEYDAERVYGSDIRKLVTWYNVIVKYAPEVLSSKVETKAEVNEAREIKSEPNEDKPTKTEKKATPKPKETPTNTKVAVSTTSKAAVKKTSSKAK
jgi:hypothetical protein